MMLIVIMVAVVELVVLFCDVCHVLVVIVDEDNYAF